MRGQIIDMHIVFAIICCIELYITTCGLFCIERKRSNHLMLAGREYRKDDEHVLKFVEKLKVGPYSADTFSHCYASGDKDFVDVFLCVQLHRERNCFKQY